MVVEKYREKIGNKEKDKEKIFNKSLSEHGQNRTDWYLVSEVSRNNRKQRKG